ncbi:hypothetical protein CVT26_002354 [Gymnopilus dilepis]|uniref:Uncharacterized protein n=1 Tax=Gymnopilus dilepis TaxID=231916 RepID=A0A409Y3K1_9AGAR|nr:hypothetical protein CVT26_002354 [Gymnopilus dilepis]
MIEFDYSPGTWQPQLLKSARIENWIDRTNQSQLANPFELLPADLDRLQLQKNLWTVKRKPLAQRVAAWMNERERERLNPQCNHYGMPLTSGSQSHLPGPHAGPTGISTGGGPGYVPSAQRAMSSPASTVRGVPVITPMGSQVTYAAHWAAQQPSMTQQPPVPDHPSLPHVESPPDFLASDSSLDSDSQPEDDAVSSSSYLDEERPPRAQAQAQGYQHVPPLLKVDALRQAVAPAQTMPYAESHQTAPIQSTVYPQGFQYMQPPSVQHLHEVHGTLPHALSPLVRYRTVPVQSAPYAQEQQPAPAQSTLYVQGHQQLPTLATAYPRGHEEAPTQMSAYPQGDKHAFPQSMSHPKGYHPSLPQSALYLQEHQLGPPHSFSYSQLHQAARVQSTSHPLGRHPAAAAQPLFAARPQGRIIESTPAQLTAYLQQKRLAPQGHQPATAAQFTSDPQVHQAASAEIRNIPPHPLATQSSSFPKAHQAASTQSLSHPQVQQTSTSLARTMSYLQGQPLSLPQLTTTYLSQGHHAVPAQFTPDPPGHPAAPTQSTARSAFSSAPAQFTVQPPTYQPPSAQSSPYPQSYETLPAQTTRCPQSLQTPDPFNLCTHKVIVSCQISPLLVLRVFCRSTLVSTRPNERGVPPRP